jgi:hypothetical protein
MIWLLVGVIVIAIILLARNGGDVLFLVFGLVWLVIGAVAVNFGVERGGAGGGFVIMVIFLGLTVWPVMPILLSLDNR